MARKSKKETPIRLLTSVPNKDYSRLVVRDTRTRPTTNARMLTTLLLIGSPVHSVASRLTTSFCFRS